MSVPVSDQLVDSRLYRGRAPIASMEGMEELDGMDILTGSNPAIQSDPQLMGKGEKIVPGLRYRHLGKSGLKVSSIGLGSLKAFSSEDPELNEELEYIDLLIVHKNDPNCPIEEVLRAMNYLINTGQIMYWGTAKWTPVEIFETFSMARTLQCVGPLCEYAEYHPFHREKVELYMAELYNKIGTGLITWSPISLGLSSAKPEDTFSLFTKLAVKSGKFNKGGIDMLNLHDGRAPNEATVRVKQLEAVAEKLGASLAQLVVAWSLRNNTSQSLILSAASVDHLCLLLNSLQLLPKLTNAIMDDIDKLLSNKPSRPPMVSTLQQRWAATGGMPPQ